MALTAVPSPPCFRASGMEQQPSASGSSSDSMISERKKKEKDERKGGEKDGGPKEGGEQEGQPHCQDHRTSVPRCCSTALASPPPRSNLGRGALIIMIPSSQDDAEA